MAITTNTVTNALITSTSADTSGVRYIRLGPIAELFIEEELGIYLNPFNAAEVEEGLLTGRLEPFILTGYLVEIKKVQFDNIRLQSPNARNAPLAVTQLASEFYLNPVLTVRNTPAIPSVVGERYLVGLRPIGAWERYKDHIAVWDGESWGFIKPEDGFILPIYAAGVAFKYFGTYPSGYWNIPPESLIDVEAPEEIEGLGEYALRLFQEEQRLREEADREITELIGKINTNVPATSVSIADRGRYYENKNVELALQEVGKGFKALTLASLTKPQADDLYQPLGIAAQITSDDVISALTYIPYDNANPAGYIDTVILDTYLANHYTKAETADHFSGFTALAGYNKTQWDTAYAKRPVSATVSGTLNKTFSLTLGDGTTINAVYLDETGAAADGNNYTSAITFDTATGNLTTQRAGLSSIVTSLDGRYLTSFSETDSLATVTGRGASTSVLVTFNTGLTSAGANLTANLYIASLQPTVILNNITATTGKSWSMFSNSSNGFFYLTSAATGNALYVDHATRNTTIATKLSVGSLVARGTLDVGHTLYVGTTSSLHGFINSDDGMYFNTNAKNTLGSQFFTWGAYRTLNSGGEVWMTLNTTLVGSGDRIIFTDPNGALKPIALGSGLSYSGGVLSSTGGVEADTLQTVTTRGATTATTVVLNGGLNSTIGTFSSYVISHRSQIDTISPGGAVGNFIGSGGYWGLRTGTDNSFNVDTHNNNSPINVFKITQAGLATFRGLTIDGGGTQYITGAGNTVLQSGLNVYLRPASGNKVILDSSGLSVTGELETATWIAVSGTAAIRSVTYGGYFYKSTANYWRLTNAGTGTVGLQFSNGHEAGGTVYGYVYADTALNFGLLIGGSWAVRTFAAGGELSGNWNSTGTFVGNGGGFHSVRANKYISETDWSGNALDVISKFKVRDFVYRGANDRTLGFVIDEIPNEVEQYAVMGTNRDIINTYTLHGLSFQAHQETKTKLELQEERIVALEKQVVALGGTI